jgi:hypothetical protein
MRLWSALLAAFALSATVMAVSAIVRHEWALLAWIAIAAGWCLSSCLWRSQALQWQGLWSRSRWPRSMNLN